MDIYSEDKTNIKLRKLTNRCLVILQQQQEVGKEESFRYLLQIKSINGQKTSIEKLSFTSC